MNYIAITGHNGQWRIYANYNGNKYPAISYILYSKRAAIAKYRADNGLRGKHLEQIDY